MRTAPLIWVILATLEPDSVTVSDNTHARSKGIKDWASIMYCSRTFDRHVSMCVCAFLTKLNTPSLKWSPHKHTSILGVQMVQKSAAHSCWFVTWSGREFLLLYNQCLNYDWTHDNSYPYHIVQTKGYCMQSLRNFQCVCSNPSCAMDLVTNAESTKQASAVVQKTLSLFSFVTIIVTFCWGGCKK